MIRIRHGIPEPMRAQAVDLYWQTFGSKLGKVMQPAPKARLYLMRVMRVANAFAALDDDGRLLGIAGYRTTDGTFAGGTMADLRAVYGRPGAAWRAALLWRLAGDAEDGRFLIDGVCVLPEARNRGIGTALIRALMTEAHVQGFSAARLDVVDSNTRARALYERLGFEVLQTHRIGVLRHIFGFDAATTMVRAVAA